MNAPCWILALALDGCKKYQKNWWWSCWQEEGNMFSWWGMTEEKGGREVHKSRLLTVFYLTENRVSSIQTRDKTNYCRWPRGLNSFHSTHLLIRGFEIRAEENSSSKKTWARNCFFQPGSMAVCALQHSGTRLSMRWLTEAKMKWGGFRIICRKPWGVNGWLVGEGSRPGWGKMSVNNLGTVACPGRAVIRMQKLRVGVE